MLPYGENRSKHALFDFDGTLSLIREGWQDVMIPMMVELLLQTPAHEDEAAVEDVVSRRGYLQPQLTGKQTIYQMIQLADEIRRRGGQPLEPLVYKYMYLDRLGERMARQTVMPISYCPFACRFECSGPCGRCREAGTVDHQFDWNAAGQDSSGSVHDGQP